MSETEKAVLNGDVEAVLSKDSLASMDLAAWLEESMQYVVSRPATAD